MGSQEKVSRLVRPEVQALSAYHVPDASGLIKLDAMENPYGWPPEIQQAWLEQLRGVPLNRYPDPAANTLRARLKQAMAVPAGMEVMLGNGSDELIQIMLQALARPGAVVLAPTPTFVMYEMLAVATGMTFVGVPLRPDDFSLDRAAMLAAITRHRPAVIFLAYPNNPTGNLFAADDIEALLAASDGLVVVDEAYHAFAGESFMERLDRHDNLVVMRTLSKLGLAGLRLGLLAGAPAWLGEFDKLRLPYNINSLSQATAEFALVHQAFLDEQTARIRGERSRVLAALQAMEGLMTVWPSQANFILFRVAGAGQVFDGLRAAGILIKRMNGTALADCLRVTVGTPEENDAFLAALRALV